jgi:hypothetical protein
MLAQAHCRRLRRLGFDVHTGFLHHYLATTRETANTLN